MVPSSAARPFCFSATGSEGSSGPERNFESGCALGGAVLNRMTVFVHCPLRAKPRRAEIRETQASPPSTAISCLIGSLLVGRGPTSSITTHIRMTSDVLIPQPAKLIKTAATRRATEPLPRGQTMVRGISCGLFRPRERLLIAARLETGFGAHGQILAPCRLERRADVGGH
jgi:hypothetical protein